VRGSGLALCATLSGYVGEYLEQTLEAVAEEKNGGFDSFSSEPLVWHNLQDRDSCRESSVAL